MSPVEQLQKCYTKTEVICQGLEGDNKIHAISSIKITENFKNQCI